MISSWCSRSRLRKRSCRALFLPRFDLQAPDLKLLRPCGRTIGSFNRLDDLTDDHHRDGFATKFEMLLQAAAGIALQLEGAFLTLDRADLPDGGSFLFRSRLRAFFSQVCSPSVVEDRSLNFWDVRCQEEV